MVRRIGLAVVVVIAIVLIAVLVNSCEISARNSALKDYNNSVASLNARSVQTGANFFKVLSGGTSDPTSLQQSLSQAAGDAATELSNGKGLSVPDEVKGAQQDFVSALQMRKDGMTNIANDVPPALQSQTSQNAINAIAAEMARFYASDVLYKDYTVPQIVGALRAAGITVGGLGGQQLNSDQFLPSIQWLDPTHVATVLHVTLPASSRTAPAHRAGPARTQAELRQRRWEHAPDGLDELDPGESGADVHARLREHRAEHRDERQMPRDGVRLERQRTDRSSPRPPPASPRAAR